MMVESLETYQKINKIALKKRRRVSSPPTHYNIYLKKSKIIVVK